MRQRIASKILPVLCGMSEAAEKILARSQKVEVGREKRVETEKQDWNGSF